MTAQISDRLRHADQNFSIISVRGEGLFDPARFGVKVQALSTACYRGFHCDYLLDTEGQLLLAEVYLGIDMEDSSSRNVTLFGRKPARYLERGRKLTPAGLVDHTWMSHDHRLSGLSEPMPFDGDMLIGRRFLEDVHELTFKGGRLVSSLNGSAAVDQIFNRTRAADAPLVSSSEIERWTEKLEVHGFRRRIAASKVAASRVRETCTLELVAGEGLRDGLMAFNIYVNGNIRTPLPNIPDKSWDRQQILALEPGAHRITLRGKDVNDPHRLESNTLHFTVADGEHSKVVVRMRDEALVLSYEPAALDG